MRAVLAAIAIVLSASSCARQKKISTPVTVKVGHTQKGIASWYGSPYHGRRAANGEVYDMHQLTAAHRTWPFHTIVRVTNLDNQRAVEVRITDRGPFVKGRIIDLSQAAAEEIALIGPGTAKVQLRVVATNVRQTPAVRKAPEIVTVDQPAPVVERYGVQVAALASRDAAEQLRVKLQTQFGSARIVAKQGQRMLWRVIAGEAQSEEEAETLAELLRAQHPNSFVVRIDE
ncbi:MAG: septal ring lytic transglycosylase RlpA family protein [Acidobacteria bacterium]|nr:septal ring lytic transglycosylase RlpA family protein [Acidobacteriota bacterium]